MSASDAFTVILRDATRGWLQFKRPERIVTADRYEEVIPALETIEAHTESGGWAAGLIGYEAAPAFDSALHAHPPSGFPLLHFGLYNAPEQIPALPEINEPFKISGWDPDTDPDAWGRMIGRIKAWLAGGDTYQVNLTMRMKARFSGPPLMLFRQMHEAQPTPYAAYMQWDKFAVCSASPELFFLLDGDHITTRPMKGTAPRALTHEDDLAAADWLKNSEKNRAENVMIVDMMRNDLGRIALPGSVDVPQLFEVEKYPTVWQMTSTVTAQTHADIPGIFRALFPCASVTGAPKPRTMEIIRALEPSPRNIYTGALGMIGPGRRARFSVAIRTVLLDTITGSAEYGTGSGIVWDSAAESEYDECRIKAKFLMQNRPDFQLLESLLWTGKEYTLLEYHLNRLTGSADYFDIPLDTDTIRRFLENEAAAFPDAPLKVRLLISRDGSRTLQTEPPKPSGRVQLVFANTPVDTQNVFLYHKTTQREVYERAMAERSGGDDVILWNTHGEITEASSSNIVARFGDMVVTPPVSCGLLPGTCRADLLDAGRITERIITREQLKNADEIVLINSVRPWREAVLTTRPEG